MNRNYYIRHKRNNVMADLTEVINEFSERIIVL